MSFAFNFLETKEPEQYSSSAKLETTLEEKSVQSEIINTEVVSDAIKRILAEDRKQMEFYIFNENQLFQSYKILKDSSLSRLVSKGEYEGGGENWECCYDLLSYLSLNNEGLHSFQNIIDIGCGQGFAGIWASSLSKSSANLIFQDLNESVLLSLTVSNILVNITDAKTKIKNDKIKFIKGDWSSINSKKLLNSISNQSNLILASEILYHVDNYASLCILFDSLLKLNENSILFIATKRHYFGLGGGSQLFIDYFKAQFSTIKCNIVHTVKDGSSMIRDILRFTYNQSETSIPKSF